MEFSNDPMIGIGIIVISICVFAAIVKAGIAKSKTLHKDKAPMA